MTNMVTPKATALPARERARVLLVDDDELMLKASQRVLRSEERDIVLVTNADDALSAIREFGFDVIVSDIRMPGLTGIDLLRAVRAVDLDVPVILLSGSPDLETAMHAVEYGAFRYATKPIEAIQLTGLVEQAIRFARLSRVKREAQKVLQHGDALVGDRGTLPVRFANALENLWIAFQPVVSLNEKRSVAYEALLRTDEASLKNPLAFLAAGELLGRSHELSRRIRSAVAVAMGDAPADVDVFVNLQAIDLLDPDLVDPRSLLASYADRIVLELTERSSFDGMVDVRQRIAATRALGFRVAIDDLGSGYAGLSCLTTLEPDIVKLDMSLIRAIDVDRRRQQIVLSIIELCSSLSLKVVVEGIETQAEREAVAALGADLCQGYLFARPAREFEAGIVSSA